MMSKRQRTPTKPPAPTPPPTEESPLYQLLWSVEDRCNHAVQIIQATERGLAGVEFDLNDEQVRLTFGAALERIADELAGISTRALAARTGGAA